MNRKQHELIVSLHNDCFERMRSIVYRKTGDICLAEEIAQETFLVAIIKVDDLMGHEKPEGWLFKTLNNIILREMDRVYRRTECPLDGAMELLYHEDDIPFELMLPKELSSYDKEMLILRLDKQWSYEQIADYRGITQAACRKQMSRAVARCKEFMENSFTMSQNEAVDGLIK